MPTVEETVEQVAQAETWDARVQAIRRVPELHGQLEHSAVYAALAERLYRPHLSPQFAFVPWRDDYELETFIGFYNRAVILTNGFRDVAPGDLIRVLREAPEVLVIFRTILGYTPGEFSAAVSEISKEVGQEPVGQARIKAIEGGRTPSEALARLCAVAIDRLMEGSLWRSPSQELRSKLNKPDTKGGWSSVAGLAAEGAPYVLLLHQRHYGGAFRTLLDATSSVRGEILEQPLEELLVDGLIPHLRTAAHNQAEIARRFGITVRPAPDFVVFRPPNALQAMIECKQANDGGTARDKAARYRSLRTESIRLGGIPLFAVLDGLGWARINDALGPVVRDSDGRVFTLETLPEMLTVQPFPELVGLVVGPLADSESSEGPG
ncbi:MAG: hypothetical protein ACRDWX_08440 [Acidimicrobiia bacterium]